MVKITDWIKPEVITHGEFADAMNAHCSMKTDSGRELSTLEIAIVEIARLKKKLAAAEGELEMFKAGK